MLNNFFSRSIDTKIGLAYRADRPKEQSDRYDHKKFYAVVCSCCINIYFGSSPREELATSVREESILRTPRLVKCLSNGGAEGIRTPDLFLAKEAFSRLNYGPPTNFRFQIFDF